MTHIEEGADALLVPLESFYAKVKQVLADEGSIGAKTEKIRQIREMACAEIGGRLQDLEQAAQEKERELAEQMARLRFLRDQMTVFRQGVLPLFTERPRKD